VSHNQFASSEGKMKAFYELQMLRKKSVKLKNLVNLHENVLKSGFLEYTYTTKLDTKADIPAPIDETIYMTS
jgi:hypothetical protein